MNKEIGDRLRRELRELESRQPQDLEDDYRRFVAAYKQWLQDPRYQAKARAEGPLLGWAAYSIGVHLAAQGKTKPAREWLQIAAHYDVGDAALRLAHLYELDSMVEIDPAQTGMPDESLDIESLALANYWYGRAREAGYTGGNELPAIDLGLAECCVAMTESTARDEAERIIAGAKADAAALVRQAHEDVQLILDEARTEYDKAALQRQVIVERMLQMRAMLHGWTAAASPPTVQQESKVRFFKRRDRGRPGGHEEADERAVPLELQRQLALCAEILHAVLVHDEPVARPMIAGIIREMTEPAENASVDELELRRRASSRRDGMEAQMIRRRGWV